MRLHVPPRERLRALHVGGYWRGPNDMVRQMMLGLRATGAEVVEYSTDAHPEALDTEGRPYDRGTTGPVWLREEHLAAPIEALRPHLIVCNAGGLAFRPAVAARLRRGSCLLGIALSDPDVFAPTTGHIAATFDRFLTNAPQCVPRYAELGAAAGVLPIATNEAFFRPLPPRPEVVCEVLVMGRAHPDRVAPVRALCAAFDTHLYGEGWEEHGLASRGVVLGEEALAALSSARMVVVFFRTGGGHALVKVGLFDFAAAGALVVTERFAAVEPYFRYDEEIVGFESTADLLSKVRWYLDHPQAADRVRRAGRARVLAEHTWTKTWPRVLADLERGPAAAAPGLGGSLADGNGRRRLGDGVVALREVTPADAEDLYRWRMEEGARPMFRHRELVPYAQHLAFVQRYFEPTNRDRWFVVEALGKAVGAVALYDFTADGSAAEWGRFVIAPEARGRGYGRRALRLLVEHARALGVRRLRCEVLAGNPVERLYRELGFVEDGPGAAADRFVTLVADLQGAP